MSFRQHKSRLIANGFRYLWFQVTQPRRRLMVNPVYCALETLPLLVSCPAAQWQCSVSAFTAVVPGRAGGSGWSRSRLEWSGWRERREPDCVVGLEGAGVRLSGRAGAGIRLSGRAGGSGWSESQTEWSCQLRHRNVCPMH